MASTIFLTLRILSVEPTDVPPNFNTFIDVCNLFAKPESDRKDRGFLAKKRHQILKIRSKQINLCLMNKLILWRMVSFL